MVQAFFFAKHSLLGVMEKIFRAARQNRIFEDVVEQIQEAIISGKLAVGDRLPPERELREMLKTSRSTIREALRVLEQKGLIEIKLGTGGGAVVKSISADKVIESLDLLIRSRQVSLDHLAEFRQQVEGDAAALAALRAKPEDKEHLKDLLAWAGQCVAKGEEAVDDFLLADKEIHLAFARITRNPIYISILKTIHANINRYFERFLCMQAQEMQENLADLEAIVDAVVNGRADLARKLSRQHVDRFNCYMHGRHKRQESNIYS